MLLFAACNSENGTSTSEVRANTETEQSLSDTIAIQNQILEHYKQTATFYNDTLGRMDSAFHFAGQIMCKLNLNNDSVNDYFVVTDYMGGPTSGIFHDGKTGDRIDFYPEHVLILSKPGIDIEYKIIDVNCGDQQKELLVRTGGGGTIGNYYNAEIYRFDQKSQKMKEIFSEGITIFEWADNLTDENILEVNHIDFNYHQKACFDTIIVQEGVLLDQETFSLNIEPKPKGSRKTFVFSPTENEFLPSTK